MSALTELLTHLVRVGGRDPEGLNGALNLIAKQDPEFLSKALLLPPPRSSNWTLYHGGSEAVPNPQTSFGTRFDPGDMAAGSFFSTPDYPLARMFSNPNSSQPGVVSRYLTDKSNYPTLRNVQSTIDNMDLPLDDTTMEGYLHSFLLSSGAPGYSRKGMTYPAGFSGDYNLPNFNTPGAGKSFTEAVTLDPSVLRYQGVTK